VRPGLGCGVGRGLDVVSDAGWTVVGTAMWGAGWTAVSDAGWVAVWTVVGVAV
jgi:hypothetical protein